jgi:hypothetical protein
MIQTNYSNLFMSSLVLRNVTINNLKSEYTNLYLPEEIKFKTPIKPSI